MRFEAIFLRPSHHPFVYSFFGLNTSATSSICLSCFKITVSDSERRLLNCQVWLRVIGCMVMQCAGAPVALNKSEVPVDKLINCCAEPGKRIWVSNWHFAICSGRRWLYNDWPIKFVLCLFFIPISSRGNHVNVLQCISRVKTMRLCNAETYFWVVSWWKDIGFR